MSLSSLEEKIVETIDDKREEILKFCQQLIKFDSHVEPPRGREEKIQNYLKEQLLQLGLKVDMWEPTEKELLKCKGYMTEQKRDYRNRPNIVGILKGDPGGKSLILNGHTDTVPIGPIEAWSHDPLGGEIENGKIYGRGAADMKGGIAAMVMALKAILEINIKLRGDLIIQCVVDEESTGNGTLACIGRGYVADAAIVSDVSELKIIRGGRGILGLKIKTTGESGHASLRWNHVSSIDKMWKIQSLLYELEKEWLVTRSQPLFLPPSIAQTIILGGSNFNAIAHECSLTCDVKYLPNDADENGFGSRIKKEIEKRVRMLAESDPWMKMHPPVVSWLTDANPALIDVNEPIIKILKEAQGKIQGEVSITVSPSNSDFRYFVLNGIPTVWFGPGEINVAHTVDEYLRIDDLIAATKILALTVINWCGVK